MLKKPRKDDDPLANERAILELTAVLLETQQAVTAFAKQLRETANQARDARAECAVLSLVVGHLLAYIADENSHHDALNIVLSGAERIAKEMAVEFGEPGAYQRIIREIREFAEARLPRP